VSESDQYYRKLPGGAELMNPDPINRFNTSGVDIHDRYLTMDATMDIGLAAFQADQAPCLMVCTNLIVKYVFKG